MNVQLQKINERLGRAAMNETIEAVEDKITAYNEPDRLHIYREIDGMTCGVKSHRIYQYGWNGKPMFKII